MFAFHEKNPPRDYDSLDECVDHSYETECFSIAKLIQGHRPKRPKTTNLKPVTIVQFKTSLGKTKTEFIRALLDSGGAGCLITNKVAKKLRLKESNLKPVRWSTPAGEVVTTKTAKSQLTLPEIHPDRLIEWDFHVTPTLGHYDMIIGRDMMEFLGIDIKFSDHTIVWDGRTIPFRDADDTSASLYVDEPVQVTEAQDRLKKILDAK